MLQQHEINDKLKCDYSNISTKIPEKYSALSLRKNMNGHAPEKMVNDTIDKKRSTFRKEMSDYSNTSAQIPQIYSTLSLRKDVNDHEQENLIKDTIDEELLYSIDIAELWSKL